MDTIALTTTPAALASAPGALPPHGGAPTAVEPRGGWLGDMARAAGRGLVALGRAFRSAFASGAVARRVAGAPIASPEAADGAGPIAAERAPPPPTPARIRRVLARRGRGRRRINLALQGGGAHGAFTWGALDRLLEEPDLDLVGISGASAGAVNAVVAASGLARGGREGAREALAAFWGRVGAEAQRSPLSPTPLERALGLGELGLAARQAWLGGVTQLASPYDLAPAGRNPLADLLTESVDFERLRQEPPVQLFVSATNVRSGKVRNFGPGEISLEVVLASACLPQLFHAVEIDGEHYWDGGYAANPPVLPLVDATDCQDIVIVQVDPVRIRNLPTTARAIRERVQVLAFNAGFMREMHEVASRQGVRLHVIEAEAAMARLGSASKLDTNSAFLARLAALGRRHAGIFLARHKAAIGRRSSLDVAARYL